MEHEKLYVYLAFFLQIEYSLIMERKVWNYIRQHHMLEEGDRVIAGISGGADSVCLLFVLLELRERIGIELIAVHVNHGLRGETARRDEEFTKELCRKNEILCVSYQKNVELIAKNRKQSIEEAGRAVRREAFEETFRKYGGTKIALAHHQNDNAETLLMNLARGSGLKGIGGIRPVNQTVIRPLLCMSRDEIETYLKDRGITYCQDETNEEDEYTRNRIRHQIIPVLEAQVNDRAVQHMNQTMEQMREIQDYMELRADEAWEQCAAVSGNAGETKILIRERGYAELHPVIRKLLVHRCLARAAESERDLGAVHVKAVMELFDKQAGKRRNLPYGLEAVRQYDGVCIRKQREDESDGEMKPVILEVPGEIKLSHMNLIISCTVMEKKNRDSFQEIPQKRYTKWFDYDIIKNSLAVRNRAEGDIIGIDRDGRTQKLKSYYINEKIPAGQRKRIPLIADGSHIIWVVGYRMSSIYQVTEDTKRILQIKITEDKENGREN